MQGIAAWLVGRPPNAVVALAATLVLPFAPVFSGTVMVLVALHSGPKLAGLYGLIAGLAVSALALVTQASPIGTLTNALVTWLPVFLLAVVMRGSRSLTLAMQVSVIVALLAAIAFHLSVGDTQAYWDTVLVQIAEVFRQAGLTEQAELLTNQRELIAPQMTVLTILTSWSVVALVLVMGYGLYQTLPGKKGEFGRFCDLNFGRVLASIMAVASLVALAADWAWIQDFAFIAFAIFWLQGLAILHWLHVDGPLPILALIVIYVMLPILNALLMMGLAVLGYTDAWFGYRARARRKDAR